MGLIPNPHRKGDYTKPEDYMETESGKFGHWETPRYATSWDWLMPVVEKIDSLGYHVTIMKTRTIIAISLNVQNHIQSIHPGYSMIEVTYMAVVDFIKWYNQQSK